MFVNQLFLLSDFRFRFWIFVFFIYCTVPKKSRRLFVCLPILFTIFWFCDVFVLDSYRISMFPAFIYVTNLLPPRGANVKFKCYQQSIWVYMRTFINLLLQ